MNSWSLNLKIMLWNVENLFLLSDSPLLPDHLKLDEQNWQKLSTSVHPNKSLFKCEQIARIIKQENPDLLLFCEVGGLESLENFNRLFLESRYSPALVEGNSDRHIDVGFLVRKDLGLYFDLVSNKNRPINFIYPHERIHKDNTSPHEGTRTSHRFSRDAVELYLFRTERHRPSLILMLTHLKSPLDRDRIDPQGFQRRRAEMKTLIDIYNEIQRQHPSVPILVAGDFNGSARKTRLDEEFQSLYDLTNLEDLTAWAGLTEQDAATFYQVNRGPRPEPRQIDYALASPHLLKLADPSSVKVVRFRDPAGRELDPPTSLEEKLVLPSDHYPIVFEIKNLSLV